MVKQAAKESRNISSVNHIEIVAPQHQVQRSSAMEGAVIQGCVSSNKDLHW